MKLTKNSDSAPQNAVLLQLKLKSKTLKPLSPYEAWEMLLKALENHPQMAIMQAEFRIKEDEKTSI